MNAKAIVLFCNPVETGYWYRRFFIYSPIHRAYKIINLARPFMAGIFLNFDIFFIYDIIKI